MGGADWFQSGRLSSAFIAFAPSGDLCLVKVWGEGLFKTSSQYFMDRGATQGAKATDAIAQIENEISLKSLALAKFIKDLKQKMGLQSPDTTDFQSMDIDKAQQFLEKIKPASDEVEALKKQAAQLKEVGGAGLRPIKGLPDRFVQCISFSQDEEAFVGFFGKVVYVSRDGGLNWTEASQGLENRDILVLGSSPSGIVFAGTYGGGLFRCSSKETIWFRLNLGLKNRIVTCLAFGSRSLVLVGTRGEGMRLSHDGGNIWNPIEGRLAEANVQAVAVDMEGTLWAGVYGRGLFFSRDGLKKWHRERIAQAFKDLWVDQNRTIWTRRQMSTFAFSENGLEFPDKNENIPDNRYTFFVPLNSSRFAAIRSDSGIDTLQLLEKTLKPLFRGIEDKKVLFITVDGTSLLAGTEHGLWVSENQGQSWRKVDL